MDPTSLAARLQQYLVESLGVAAPLLGAQWASSNPAYHGVDGTGDSTPPMSLTFSSAWNAPFTGMLSYSGSGTDAQFTLDGLVITGSVAVLSQHPHAQLRLRDIFARRFGNDGSSHSVRPVPTTAVIRMSSPPSPLPVGLSLVNAGDPGNTLPAGTVTFHDANGLLIDPLFVASAWTDILNNFEVLGPNGFAKSQLNKSAGYVDSIAALDTSNTRYIHIVNPHGGSWTDPGSGHGLAVTASGTPTRISSYLPAAFPDSATLGAEDTSSTQPLRWGPATFGELGKTSFSAPALAAGASLTRDFLRVIAVDLNNFLLGNRTTQDVDGVLYADAGTASEPAPLVREGSTVRFCTDGIAVLGEAHTLLSHAPTGGTSFLEYLVSPAISDSFSIPSDTSANSRWGKATATEITPSAVTPQDWDPSAATLIRPGQSTKDGKPSITAAWNSASGTDIVVTFAAGAAPAGAFLRIYNRIFYTGPSLDQSATLFRGDGGSIIAGAASQPVQVLLKDPLNLAKSGQIGDATLHFDLHVLPNAGSPPRERIFGGYSLPVGKFSATSFTLPTATNNFSIVPVNRRGICTAAMLGLHPSSNFSPSVVAADSVAAQVVELIRQLLQFNTQANAAREALRIPTMARTETIAAVGISSGSAGKWETVLSGGFLLPESHVEKYQQGNPGGAAGPETSVTGIFAGDQLGYDLALAANRRANDLLNRLEDYDNAIFNAPPVPTSPSTISGAVLQTVSACVETPEFGLLPESDLAGLPNTVADLKNYIQGKINLPSSLSMPDLFNGNPANGDRIVAEIKREFYAARYGRRDWQWSLEFAISHARDLIYMETQCLTQNDDNEAYSFDLVDTLVHQLKSQPSLRFILVCNKKLSFDPSYNAWAQYFYGKRTDAWNQIAAAAPGRVVAVHPIGFPGRPLNIRTTVAIVDDVWCSVGTGVPRKRGFGFDGAIDVALHDAQIADGRGSAIQQFRRTLMANILGTQAPPSGGSPNADWVRLTQPRAAFAAFSELVQQGGRGLVEPQIWAGPDPSLIQAQSAELADPDGRDLLNLLPDLLTALTLGPLEGPPS
ncbi:MAG: hypothetical protein WBV80_05540 [Mycobacterium sp.]